MASAVLASRNESSWAQSGGGAGGGFMGKTPFSHTQLNPNPKKKQKQFHHTSNGRHLDDSPAVTQTASDDAYSFNQRPMESTTNVDGPNFGGYMTYNVASYNKSELHELRSRLVAQLEQIRNLKDRIESGQFSTVNPRSQGKSKKPSGNKRPTPSGSIKDVKNLPNGVEIRIFGNPGGGVKAVKMESIMKDCKQILAKLMKHKNGWIFNTPVDAEALGLHDYHRIIKRPIDLGTVKSNLAKNFYPTPTEFAADVRLTFNNALLYNPKTDQVNGFAEQLLGRFEDLFRPLQDKLIKLDGGRSDSHPVDELQGSSWNHIPTPDKVKKPKATPAPHISKKQERMQNHSSASTPSLPVPPPIQPALQQSPLSTLSPVRAPPAKPQSAAKPTMVKQPKPRAKDPNKREMSMEEKHKLGVGLQSLSQEKMPQLVQIIRKRNEHLAQDGDEIELDIEALDTETLWELDRFVTNWKKMVSKTKRQALMMNNLGAPAASAVASAATTSAVEADGPTTSEKNDTFKKPKKGDVGDEDVEIEDDEPATHFPPVEIEKDEGGGRDQDNVGGAGSSSSSSSSSGSSSSSDSDSGSSSGSDSDADDAHS
ncbi:unnamed protein product [Withania somnifera]